MIKLNSDDILVVGHCPRRHLQVLFADVAESSHTLAGRHACGPASTLVLAESLVAVGLLSAEVRNPDETISLRIEFKGPVGGSFVEASGNGSLRGYTDRKVLVEFDSREDLNLEDVTGSSAQVSILRADAGGGILSQAALEEHTGKVRGILQAYYAHSLQIPVLVSLHVSSLDGRMDRAQGLVVQCMPDGDLEFFTSLADRFEDGTVTERLALDCSLDSVREILASPDLRVDATRPLLFRCRCSRERAEAALSSISVRELNGIRRTGKAQHVACHLCGADYVFGSDMIGEILARKNGSPAA